MTCRVADYSAIFHSYSIDEFPIIHIPSAAIKLPASEFEAITRLRFVAVDKGSKPELAGVWFDADGWGVTTDGIRLAWRRPVKGGLRNLFVPVYLLERVVGWEESPSQYVDDKNGRFWFLYPNCAVFAVKPSASFPDVRGILTAGIEACKKAHGFIGDREHLNVVVRRLLLMAQDVNAKLELSVEKSLLILRVPATAQYRDTAVERVAVKTHTGGTVSSMCVNGRLLLDAVERFEEFFLIEQGLVAFSDERTYGHIIARLVN